MKCIVLKKVFDQTNIVELINSVPYFELVSTCTSVFEAYEILNSKKIDLIFLDTDLPKISGMEFIQSLNTKPFFIFFSSNVNLAIEGFNLNALDFLLKPFSFDRFLKAANKALVANSLNERILIQARENVPNNFASNEFVMVKTDYKTIVIKLENILYIEGLKDYIKIYTSQNPKPVITLNSLKKLQQNLPPEKFSRIHKSYIVGLEHIKSINKSQVVINEKYIPIGESYKNIFSAKMVEMGI
jgi:DNA-binding LytR/AlgR family response regulator